MKLKTNNSILCIEMCANLYYYIGNQGSWLFLPTHEQLFLVSISASNNLMIDYQKYLPFCQLPSSTKHSFTKICFNMESQPF
jgi:hypothetical protein